MIPYSIQQLFKNDVVVQFYNTTKIYKLLKKARNFFEEFLKLIKVDVLGEQKLENTLKSIKTDTK